MTSRARFVLLGSIISLGLALSAEAAPARRDPLDGTWRLNVAKSTMKGPTASSSETLVFRVSGTEESFHSNAVQASDGAREHTGYKATYGGPPAPTASIYVAPNGVVSRITQGMVQVTRIDDRTRERRVTNLAGVQGLRARREISPDGKTLNASLLDASGKAFQVRVFDRVE